MEYKKGDVITLTIEDMGVSGEGIGKVNGYTLFVKDAIVGDVITAKIINVKKNYGYAKIVNIVKPSLDRVQPVCQKARQCGGCQLQQMRYGAQLAFKQKMVQGNLLRIGGIADCNMEPIIGMEEPYRYRNKAQYPVGTDREGNIVMGFYAGRTHVIIPCTDCKIGHKDNAVILETIKKWMEENQISAYEESIGRGMVRHVLIRTGYHTDEVMVCLVMNAESLGEKAEKALVDRLRLLEGCNIHISSIMLNINKQNTNVIMGGTSRCLWGKTYIEDYIGKIRYHISPLSFYQVNPSQTEKLYAKVLEYANLTGSETVWDMYCGIGTISLFLASFAKKVYGVEVVPQAIEDARDNARVNHIDHVTFFTGKAEEVVPMFYQDMEKRAECGDQEAQRAVCPDVVVVDPPRKGCDERLLETIVGMSPRRIVYVSCDSATLARDLKYLVGTEAGYSVEKSCCVDMFPGTVHVECVVLMSRVEK